MAEALMNRWGKDRFRAFSAGISPKGEVHPLALEIVSRYGLPAEGLASKSWTKFLAAGADRIDFIIMIRDQAAGEECPAMLPSYECCSGRGSLVALDAATGKQVWKTYTIAEEPHIVGKTKAGRPIWGPSGASIWSAPTLDVERQAIYVGTGDNFSDPPTGTSDAVDIAINVPICYTRALTCYAIKCLTTPKIPNNEGSVTPIVVTAPPGCALNPLPPSPNFS